MLKQKLIEAAKAHAEAEVKLHKTNIDVYMEKVVGIGEHSDITQNYSKRT